MSVLCCRIPDLLIGLTCRDHTELVGQPLALVGIDEHVCATSREAQMSGVHLEMTPRQAQMHCPDVILRPLNFATCQPQQNAFVGTLAQCGLPVEELGWGTAYMDLSAVANTGTSVKPIVAELGKQVRGLFGEKLLATAGWDTGKFTARAAATSAQPGRAHLVDRADEERFLAPLSITLLPLPKDALQQLYWLGIQTLEQFAHLPAGAVLQRYGRPGQIAQQWAKGNDDRPVCANTKALPESFTIDFDPPTSFFAPVLEATLAKLSPYLALLADQFEGCRHLRLELKFTDRSTRAIDCAFVEPVSHGDRLRLTIAHQFEILNWPAELDSVRVTLLERGELVSRQLTLFDLIEKRTPLDQLVQKLSHRYGATPALHQTQCGASVFFQAHMTDEHHPIAERRVTLKTLTASAPA
jgi:nucleotidyltransferase/DNA polymerase involved in DNA repair